MLLSALLVLSMWGRQKGGGGELFDRRLLRWKKSGGSRITHTPRPPTPAAPEGQFRSAIRGRRALRFQGSRGKGNGASESDKQSKQVGERAGAMTTWIRTRSCQTEAC